MTKTSAELIQKAAGYLLAAANAAKREMKQSTKTIVTNSATSNPKKNVKKEYKNITTL